MKKKLIIALMLAMVMLVPSSVAFAQDPPDLAVNDENPWEDEAFIFEDISPSGDSMPFDFKLHNVGDSPGILTFSMSVSENDMDNAPLPDMSANEFASLVYVEAVDYQYIWLDHPDKVHHPDGYIGSVRDDLDEWLGMDSEEAGGNEDGKVSLYEICQIGTIHYDSEDDPLEANLEGNPLNGAEITYFIEFQLGDSLNPFEAGGIILTGVEDNSFQGDGISVTISATLEGTSVSDTEQSSSNVFQAGMTSPPALAKEGADRYKGLSGVFWVEVFNFGGFDTYKWDDWSSTDRVLAESVFAVGEITGANAVKCALFIPEGTHLSYPNRPGILVTNLMLEFDGGEVSFEPGNVDFSQPCTLTLAYPDGTKEVVTFTEIRDGLAVPIVEVVPAN